MQLAHPNTIYDEKCEGGAGMGTEFSSLFRSAPVCVPVKGRPYPYKEVQSPPVYTIPQHPAEKYSTFTV